MFVDVRQDRFLKQAGRHVGHGISPHLKPEVHFCTFNFVITLNTSRCFGNEMVSCLFEDLIFINCKLFDQMSIIDKFQYFSSSVEEAETVRSW
jgi:hypothetical protein